MSVLIKDATMPKCCDDCNLESYCNLWTRCRNEEERHPDCPLVSVPEPHGRLIDADAFISFIREKWDSYDQWFAEMLEARPTIIEAEGRET